MPCPEEIKVTHTTINKEKCNENFLHWSGLYDNVAADSTYKEHLELSENVLPCHTFGKNSLKGIFGYDDAKSKFDKTNAGILSAKERLKLSGKTAYDPIPPHMKEAIDNGHDIFSFAYHGVHNPYHRNKDDAPIRPFGAFLKKEAEQFSCVHGSPWDVTVKNKMAEDDVEKSNLDKYYLLPNDLRRLKPIQIQKISYLGNSFWFYFGNPYDWNNKGYGKKLFETAGEMRYLSKISPSDIAAILWPMWHTDDGTVDENLDLQNSFRKEYGKINIVNYPSDKYENWALSLVEASYYVQRYYLEFDGKFPPASEIARIKINGI